MYVCMYVVYWCLELVGLVKTVDYIQEGFFTFYNLGMFVKIGSSSPAVAKVRVLVWGWVWAKKAFHTFPYDGSDPWISITGNRCSMLF